MTDIQEIYFTLYSNNPTNETIHSINTRLFLDSIRLNNVIPTITVWEGRYQVQDFVYPQAENNFEVFSKILEEVINYAKRENLKIYEIGSSRHFEYLSLDQLNQILSDKNLSDIPIAKI